jgi:GntR family transcriptional regulator, transcriptional repressor for pyruvate dehydrogenase complex
VQVASLPRSSPLFIEPVKRETVMDTVARRIESLIRTGELRVGSRLPTEPKLAAMLGVSRSSLREALKGLVFLGLIKARPGYGTYIQSTLGRVVSRHFQWMLLLQEIKYLELYELRQILEPAVAALAARRASKDDIDKMEAAIDEMRKSFDLPERYMEAEMAFHEGFTQAAKNVATQTMLRMMYDALAEGRRRVLPLISDMEQNFARHKRILKCIVKRDAKGARKAVLDDLLYAESLLRKDLETQERLRAGIGKPEPASAKTKSSTRA